MKKAEGIGLFLESVIHSYTQVFFSKNKVFGYLLILITFLDPSVGMSGLLAVIFSNAIVLWLGFDKKFVQEGSYGFNSLLVGLGLGLYYQPNLPFFILLLIASLITVFLTIIISGALMKYGLPYLSLPFVLGLWTVILASRSFLALGISEQGVYVLNELYAKGDIWLVNIYNWLNQTFIPEVFLLYLKSLAAILFQFNILSGILIAIGLLIYSRIAFTLSFLGFATAYYFYGFIGADIDTLSYSYIGFNFILSGIAIGGFFLVPSKYSYLWAILLTPVLVILTASLGNLLSILQIGIYSLPFNLVVLTFLFVVKLRSSPDKLTEPLVQLYSPEKILYERKSNRFRYANFKSMAIGLPVFGEWYISQGKNGEITHKEDWKDAWDFVIIDQEQKQYRNEGNFREDYYCYNKPIVAPADGTVEDIKNGVEENDIGDSNLYQNWGNTIVIKHEHQLYSQLSHLKKGTIQVRRGDEVKKGDVLAHCGNSGRSPYPHLHFQLQKTPYIGSKTLEYPLSAYLNVEKEGLNFKFFDFPTEGKKIKSIESTKLLTRAFHFIPGKRMHFQEKRKGKIIENHWEVQSDSYNNSYFYCHHTQSKAYFVNEGELFYFTFFEGKKHSLLYYFYLAAYKIVLGYYKDLEINDHFPIHRVSNSWKRVLYDFVAPFFDFMKGNFRMKFVSIDDEMMPENIRIESITELELFNKKKTIARFEFLIQENSIREFNVELEDSKIEAKCEP